MVVLGTCCLRNLFRPQRFDGIDPAGASRGEPKGEQADRADRQGDAHVDERIVGHRAAEELFQRTSEPVAAADRLRSLSGPAESVRAAQMFLDGLDPAAIALRALPSVAVWELRQVKSSQGGKYQAALGEVLGLIREGLRPA